MARLDVGFCTSVAVFDYTKVGEMLETCTIGAGSIGVLISLEGASVETAS